MAKLIADKTGLPIVTLYDIPNQPLYGFKEDGLIAYTFRNTLRPATHRGRFSSLWRRARSGPWMSFRIRRIVIGIH